MNFRKWACELFGCNKHQDCHQAVEKMQNLMKSKCLSQIKLLNEKHRERLGKLKNKIHLLNQKIDKQEVEIEYWQDLYNEQKAIPKRPFYCRPDECPYKPDGKKKSPKLAICKGRICYEDGGTIPIKLRGVYNWEALHRISRIIDEPEFHITYDDYIGILTQFPTNCVRQGTVPDISLMEKFTEDMRKAGKIVEWTIYNRTKFPMCDPKKAIDALIVFPNVFFDVNEFNDYYDDIEITIDLGNYVVNKGGIFAAGSWGHSKNGKKISDEFYKKYSKHQIGSVHREWDRASIKRVIEHGKIAVRDEYFDYGNDSPQYLGFDGFKRIMLETFEAGAQGCLYYAFIDSWIGKPTKGREKAEKYLEFAANLEI